MNTIRQMLALPLTLSLIFSPYTASAADGKAEKEVQQRLDRLRTATFDYLANQLTLPQTAEEYDSWFLTGLKAEDRKEAMAAFRQIKKIDRVRRSMDTLIFQADGKTVRLTWPDVRKNQFRMNEISLEYDPQVPLKIQMEAWAAKASGKKTALLQLLIPDAEAGAFLPVLYWVGTAVGAAFIGAISSETIKNGRCALTKGTSLDGDDCINLRRARLEAQQTGMPAFDAVKNMTGSDNSNVLSKFEGPKFDRQCPSNNDGKDRFLITQVRTVRIEGGTKIPTSDWVYVWVKLSPKGDPQDMILTSTPEEIKPENVNTAASASRLVAHIAFDPTTNRPVSFRVPNPEAKAAAGAAGILYSPTLNLNLGMDLTPQQKDIIANATDIVKWAIFRSYNCVVQVVVAEQQAGIQSGSPGQPKELLPEVPPAQIPPAIK